MRFCTVINCMDGRVQLPVIRFLQQRFDADYVDSITEAGPTLILAEEEDTATVQGIHERLRISIERHGSTRVAIVGHYDCAGNPAPQDAQMLHIRRAVESLRDRYGNVEVIGLWVDENFRVHEVTEY